MNFLILGDVMGPSGRDALKNKLPKIILGNLLFNAFLPDAPITSPKINKFINKYLFL